MRILVWGGVGLSLVLGFWAGAQDEQPAPPDAQTAPEAPAVEQGEEPAVDEPVQVDPLDEARRLVRDLANESYRVREEATQKLWNLGEDGLAALEEGGSNEDPEIAFRSQILLQRIRTGITPGTPQAIVDLVQRYFRSDATGKKAVLFELQRQKAYPQMLRLYRFEDDPAVRSECDEILEKTILPVVLGELLENRDDAAEELLRLAPGNEQNARRLASLLRVRGTLDAELERSRISLQRFGGGVPADDLRHQEVATLHLALLRASGKHEEARRLATDLGRDDLVAALALFEGDPVPYLRWTMKQLDESPIVRVHAEVVLKRWQGDYEGADLLMRNLAREAREAGEGEDSGALVSLLLNGYVDLALPVVFRDDQDAAFGYYETLEQPRKALEAIGYAGTREQKDAWLNERLEAMRNDWIEAEVERFDVLTVASFMNSRGEDEEARRLVLELSKLALAEGNESFLELLGRLHDFGGSLYQLAFLMASDWLGKEADKADARRVLGSLFGEGDVAERLWNMLGEAVAVPASERLLLLGGLYGASHLEAERFEEVRGKLLAMAGEGEKDVQISRLSALLEAAEARDDVGAALKLAEKLAALDGAETWTDKLANYHSYIGNWDAAAQVLDKLLQDEPHHLPNLARYGGMLIRLGRPEDARKPLRAAERFALDEPLRLYRLAADLERSGALDEAESYWRIAMMTNPPSDWYWLNCAPFMAKHARLKKQWRTAAAFAEIDAMQYIKGRSGLMNPVTYIRKRFSADLYRGLALLEEGDREGAQRLFRGCFELLNGDGVLADEYFPLLREAGMVEEHDRNFALVYERLEESIKAFPKAHNTYNSAAWMASRAGRNLDDALEKIRVALSMRPKQAAYLDTMAEVWFARRDREKAVEWSWKAVQDSFHGGFSTSASSVSLREQYDRFRSEEFPVP